jgi:ABC-type multidrug transport system fused ATPase/permease subunit
LISILKKLKVILTKKDKKYLIFLFLFSLLIAVIETIGISAIMPFISVATDFSIIETNSIYSEIYNFLEFETQKSFVISFGILLIFFYIFRGVINITFIYFLNKFTQGRYHLLAYRLFQNYLGMPYKEFTSKNSSDLTKTVVNEATNLTQLISSSLFLFSELSVLVAIYSIMLYVNWKITLVLTVVLLLNGILMLKTISTRIRKAGVIRADLQKKFYEIVNRSFGNFKFIKLRSNEEEILKEFGVASYGFSNAKKVNATLNQVPKYFLEVIAFSIVVSIVTYLVYQYDDIASILSMVMMFVVALYRLMPSVNRITSSYNQILFLIKSLDIVHNDLMFDTEKLGKEKIELREKIELENISFHYEIGKDVLKEINLEIDRGEKVAFVGESGSGKSTLVDLITGLYKPTSGKVLLDGVELSEENVVSWRREIGYIPQSVYLFDGTVSENVVFGLDVDVNRVDEVLKQARIYEFLQTKEGRDTLVGEGGVKLSGGQKQRIAIARALYSNPSILVLDEATSALDTETETAIMNEIYEVSKGLTLLIIAHRLSTIEKCEKVFKLDSGNLLTKRFFK